MTMDNRQWRIKWIWDSGNERGEPYNNCPSCFKKSFQGAIQGGEARHTLVVYLNWKDRAQDPGTPRWLELRQSARVDREDREICSPSWVFHWVDMCEETTQGRRKSHRRRLKKSIWDLFVPTRGKNLKG